MTEKLELLLREITKTIDLDRVSQGAEAIVYRTKTHPYLSEETLKSTLSRPSNADSYIVKYRPPKPYRHPVLDASLTKRRTLAEARLLHKLTLLGINVPRLIFADFRNGLLWMEDVGTQEDQDKKDINDEDHDSGSNGSVKVWIWDQEKLKDPGSIEEDENMKSVLHRVGQEVGKLHLHDVIHGDLTTSNIILRESTYEPVLIDFGLGSQSTLAEDKAVDLYVLERAVNSTHPIHSDIYNAWLLEGYRKPFESKVMGGPAKIREILRKLEDVRMRGRKRSMEG